MSRDVIALLTQSPSRRSLLESLAEADPALRIRLIAEGTVVELREDSGRLVLAVQSGQRLATSSEADRLLEPGLTNDLPAQPLWVEARGTDLEDVDTLALARRFTHALVQRHGGLVWEPPSQLPRDPWLRKGTDHPAVSAVTEKNAVLVQDRPTVPLSGWLVDALARYGRQGLGLQLLTPSSSMLTPGLSLLMSDPNATWVVRTKDGHHYNGFNGLPLTWQNQVGYAPDPNAQTQDGPHQDFQARPEHTTASHLHVDLQMDHPVSNELELGQVVELLAEHLGGASPSVWGVAEPLSRAWDTVELTTLARKRAPGETTVLFHGPYDSSLTFAGRWRASRTNSGVREHVRFTLGAQGEPVLGVLEPLVRDLAERDGLRSMTIQRAIGRADLCRPPRWAGVPIPIGLAVGTEGVLAVGKASALAAPVKGKVFGPPMTPVLWYRIGDGVEPDSWKRFKSLMQHLRPTTAKQF